ncbi:hypothetical protein [uncultured Winogradskyella sp.]|uniref:hypothetical protein n=1 Tax=uncultured Winogradskyella sp. TaxID=395353 RepID=UPI002626713D|nr:hypothetical protein [uncultured Winogradskyella sp.]
MLIIEHNPYRLAGVLANSSEKEILKSKGRIKAHAKVGRDTKSDFDFAFLNTISRTELDIVNKAFSNIQQNHDKVYYSLFWFLNASPFDNTAIEYLKNGDEEKAIEIWEKVTEHKDVNSKNFSAFNNLGTYKLLSRNKSDIKSGIEAKIKLIESDYFENFVHSVADETYTINKKKQSEKLVDVLLDQFKNEYSSSETLQLFSGCNGTTQKYLSKKFTEEPLHNIESQIENCKKKRKTNSGNAYEFGLELFTNTKEDLSILKSLLGTNDLKYKTVADQLANEIMQCGIDYFKEWQDIKDPSDEGLKLLKFAKSIAIGSLTRDRIKQNSEGIQEWAETAPIQEDLVYITGKLKSFQDSNNSMANAKALVLACKSRLQNIRGILGSNDEFYLNISSAVVNNVLGMVIEVVNESQSGIEYNRSKLIILPKIVSEAVSVISSIGSFDMNSLTRIRYNENKNTITNINSQLSRIRNQTTSYGSSSYSSSSRSTSSDNEGCAPWVYVVGAVIFFIILANACN